MGQKQSSQSSADHIHKLNADVLNIIVDKLDPASAVCLGLTNKSFHSVVTLAQSKHSLKDVLPKPAWPFCYADFEGERKLEEIESKQLEIHRQAGYYALLIQKLSPSLMRTHKICTRDAKWVPRGKKHGGCYQCAKSYKRSIKERDEKRKKMALKRKKEMESKSERTPVSLKSGPAV